MIVRRYEKMINSHLLADSSWWCNHGSWQEALEYAPAAQYGGGAMGLFEGVSIRPLEKHHEYLTQKYGDYMKGPPEEGRVGHHYYDICDCEWPYTAYRAKMNCPHSLPSLFEGGRILSMIRYTFPADEGRCWIGGGVCRSNALSGVSV